MSFINPFVQYYLETAVIEILKRAQCQEKRFVMVDNYLRPLSHNSGANNNVLNPPLRVPLHRNGIAKDKYTVMIRKANEVMRLTGPESGRSK